MIINNKNGFKLMVNDEMLRDLEYVDIDALVEILEEAPMRDIEDGWIRDSIFETTSYELYYYGEAEKEINDAKTCDDIKEAAEISGALEEFDGDINSFKFKIGGALRWINVSREIADLLEYIEILDDEPVEFEELDKEIQEKIKEDFREDFMYNWCDAEQWLEFYNEYLKNKHYIFKELYVKHFRLDHCQGDFIELGGFINPPELKRLIQDYRYKIFDVFNGYNIEWTPKEKRYFIKTVSRLYDEDYIEIKENNYWNNRIRLTSDIFWINYYNKLDASEHICYIEEFAQYLIEEIERVILRDAYDSIESYIEGDFESYFDIYIEDHLFTKDGEPVDRW